MTYESLWLWMCAWKVTNAAATSWYMGIYKVVWPDRIDEICMQLSPSILWTWPDKSSHPSLILSACLPFRLIASKFSLFQHEARVLDLSMPKLIVGSSLRGYSALMCWKNLVHSTITTAGMATHSLTIMLAFWKFWLAQCNVALH